MQLLITGGAGFIGSNYVRSLLANRDDRVVVLDALTYAGNLDNLRGLDVDPRFRFLKGDICDRDTVRAAMEGCDRVVHFAAETHVDRSITDPDSFVLTNCHGTNVICDTARQLGIQRVLHISTDEVYGSVEQGSSSEEDLLVPRSPYSAAKAGSDLIAFGYRSTFGLDVVVTRASNNYGPYQFPEKVIPLFVTNLFNGDKVPLYGDGMNVRDWLYVQDHCTGIDTVLRDACRRGDLQHRRRQRDHEPGIDRAADPVVRTRRILHPARHRSPRARPPVLRRLLQTAGAGLGADERLRGWIVRDRGLVPRQPLVVGAAQIPCGDGALNALADHRRGGSGGPGTVPPTRGPSPSR